MSQKPRPEHIVGADVCAVVPVGDPSRNKSRLEGCLTHEGRRALVAAMLLDVTDTLRLANTAEVFVLAATPGAAAIARRIGVPALLQPGEAQGLNCGIEWARGLCGERILVAMADLPELTVGEVNAVLAVDAEVVISPGHDGGTGGLVLARTAEIVPSFGNGSAARHRAAAARAMIDCATVEARGFALDVDVPEDLERLARLDNATGRLVRDPARWGVHRVA